MTNRMGNTGQQIVLTESSFIERYGNTQVEVGRGDMKVTLRQAVAMEAAFCPADREEQTPEDRLGYLAKLVGEHALEPSHHHLLPQEGSKT